VPNIPAIAVVASMGRESAFRFLKGSVLQQKRKNLIRA
jgi:hypothetical protein